MKTLLKRKRRKRIIESPPSRNGHGTPLGPIKINLGCGNKAIHGYDNRDRQLGHEAYPLPDADESVDEVRASHLLEHFPHQVANQVVAEWVRVLKPGGWLKIAVPDFGILAESYRRGEKQNFQGFIMGGQTNADDFHCAIYDEECLRDTMAQAGLVDFQRWQTEIPDCAGYPFSLNLMGRKPPAIPKLNIGCAMSTPRLGFQDNFFGWAAALMPYGIVPTRYEGCYWGQCLERVMTTLVDKNDWILTLDYDTICTKETVGIMLRLAHEHPEADAIAALQMSRGRDSSKPLLVIRNEEGAPITNVNIEHFMRPLIKVETAHFGLTLINCEKLKKMPHPWFCERPNEAGEWGEGRLDADIYFWHRWRDAGHSCYVANRAVIGHAELMITWPDKEMNPIHQYPADFHEHGAPLEAWQ